MSYLFIPVVLVIGYFLYKWRERARTRRWATLMSTTETLGRESVRAPDRTPISTPPSRGPVRWTRPKPVSTAPSVYAPRVAPRPAERPYRDDDGADTTVVSGLTGAIAEVLAETVVETLLDPSQEVTKVFEGDGGTFGGAGASWGWGDDNS